MRYVLDASVALTFVLPDEQDSLAFALLARLADDTLCVPPIWPTEMLNALLAAERQKRIKPRDVDDALMFIEKMHAEIDTTAPPLATIRALAASHALTAYDSLYLELALRQRLPLATNDVRLSKAAKAAGVATL